ncbi:hypothetical protein HY837_01630 [archaeon]|nr:hypothetical protein [archaeon]
MKKIISSLIGIASLALPAYASADSISQQERNYKTKMLECVKDKVLTNEEIKELYKTLKNLETGESNNSVDFSSLLEKYPGLVDNRARVTYSFNKPLSAEETEALKGIIRTNPSPKLEELLGKESLNIQDLALSYLMYNNQEGVMEPIDLLTKTTMLGLMESHLKAYENYFKRRKDMEDSWMNTKKIMFIGFVQLAVYEQPTNEYKETRNTILEQVRTYTQMNDVELKSLKEDLPDYHFPNPLDCIVLLSAIAPAILRFLLKNYRRESHWTDAEGGYHACDGVVSALGVDALHPYILPARLLVPFIWEIGKGVKK